MIKIHVLHFPSKVQRRLRYILLRSQILKDWDDKYTVCNAYSSSLLVQTLWSRGRLLPHFSLHHLEIDGLCNRQNNFLQTYGAGVFHQPFAATPYCTILNLVHFDNTLWMLKIFLWVSSLEAFLDTTIYLFHFSLK